MEDIWSFLQFFLDKLDCKEEVMLSENLKDYFIDGEDELKTFIVLFKVVKFIGSRVQMYIQFFFVSLVFLFVCRI